MNKKNHGGTKTTVNETSLILEVKRSIKNLNESIMSLNKQLTVCEHFAVNLGPDVIKSIILLENQIAKVG